jgi:transposase
MLGVSDKSIQTWRKIYLDGGLSALLTHEKKGREFKVFSDEERKFIEDTLTNSENGVQGYKELQRLMSKQFSKDFAYTALVGYCKKQFGSKIKVARPSHVKKDEKAVSDLKKKIGDQLETIIEDAGEQYSQAIIYFEDESRFGLITKNGKVLTAKGIKPICKVQQIYKSTWLYGLFSPMTGDHFMLEFPTCDSDCFQVFPDLFAERKPKELLIMVLDNSSVHKAKKLVIPFTFTIYTNIFLNIFTCANTFNLFNINQICCF